MLWQPFYLSWQREEQKLSKLIGYVQTHFKLDTDKKENKTRLSLQRFQVSALAVFTVVFVQIDEPKSMANPKRAEVLEIQVEVSSHDDSLVRGMPENVEKDGYLSKVDSDPDAADL